MESACDSFFTLSLFCKPMNGEMLPHSSTRIAKPNLCFCPLWPKIVLFTQDCHLLADFGWLRFCGDRAPRSLVDGRETNLGWQLCGGLLIQKKLTGSWLFEGDSQDVTFVLLFSTVWFTSLWWDQLDPKKFSPNPGNDRAARHWSESRGGSANRNFSHFFGGIPPIERLLFVDDHWSVIRCNEGKVEIDHWCNDAEMQSEKDFLSRRRN